MTQLKVNLTYHQYTEDSATVFHEYYEIVNEHGKVVATTPNKSQASKKLAELFVKAPEMLTALQVMVHEMHYEGIEGRIPSHVSDLIKQFKPKHLLSCALHNGPAMIPYHCDCGADPGMTPEKYGSEFPSECKGIKLDNGTYSGCLRHHTPGQGCPECHFDGNDL